MDAVAVCPSALDPRIRRTRQMLQDGLAKLLETESLEKLSVQEIADAATVNRATFYDHYPDKYALFESLIASRFFGLLHGRKIKFDGTCPYAIGALILAVCDYLAGSRIARGERPGAFEPLMEATMITLIRQVLLEGLAQHSSEERPSPPMVATTASWAIFGAAKEWSSTPERLPAEQVVDTILKLVAPILQKGLPVDNV